MSTTMDAAALLHLQQTGITISSCLKITLADARVFAFTNSSQDLTIDDVVYSSTAGQTPSAVQTTSGFGVDSIDIETLKELTGISTDEILSGAFDSATFIYFLANYEDTTQDFGILRAGRLGQITANRNSFTIELRGIIEAYSKQTLEMTTPACRADLGDARCQVELDPAFWTASTVFTERAAFDEAVGSTVKPTSANGRYFFASTGGTSDTSEPSWNLTIGGTTVDGSVIWTAAESLTVTGAVTSVSTATKRVFQDTSLTKDDEFFDGGLVTWLTGSNAGRSFEVKRYETVGSLPEVEFIVSTFFDIEVGDTYTISAGCFKRVIEDCLTRFANTFNFRGEPYVSRTFQISRATV
ncbi:MAG: DUF2163 domain-containing protein [Dehalococcoidales bacterium]